MVVLLTATISAPTLAATSAFPEAADRLLTQLAAMKGSCTDLLGRAAASQLLRKTPSSICARMSQYRDRTMSMINIVIGDDQIVPWQGDGSMMSALFTIADKQQMSIVILGSRKVIVLSDASE